MKMLRGLFLVLTCLPGLLAWADAPIDVRLNGQTPQAFRDAHPDFQITFVAPRAERRGDVDFVPATLLESWYQLSLQLATVGGRQAASFSGTSRFDDTPVALTCTQGDESFTLTQAGQTMARRFPPGSAPYVNEFGEFMLPAIPLVRTLGGRAFVQHGVLNIMDPGQEDSPAAAPPVAPPPAPPEEEAPAVEAPELPEDEAVVAVPPADDEADLEMASPDDLLPDEPDDAPLVDVQESILEPTPSLPDYFAQLGLPVVFPDAEDNPTSVVLRRFEVEPRVQPGATIEVHSEWAFRSPPDGGNYNPTQTVFITLLSDWEPLRPLATLVNGELQGEPRVERRTTVIQAPVTPGDYRLRWVAAFAFAPVERFLGEAPGGVFAPGVGPYGEIQFTVVDSRVVDTATPTPSATPTATTTIAEPRSIEDEAILPREPEIADDPEDALDEARDYFTSTDQPVLWPAIFPPDGAVEVHDFYVPDAVRPGESVEAEVEWSYRRPRDGYYNPEAVISISVLGDWLPNEPLTIMKEGEALGQPRLISQGFRFLAPRQPGTYRLRWVAAWAYSPVTRFRGGPPGGSLQTPGTGPYAEIAFRVMTPVDAPTPVPPLPHDRAAADGHDWFERANAPRVYPPGATYDQPVAVEAFVVPERSRPGERQNGRIDWSFEAYRGEAYDTSLPVHVRVYGEWQPDKPLKVLMNGTPQGSPRPVRKFFWFEAPTQPGVYRVRWVVSWGFRPVDNFFGADPASRPPGVGPYAEVTLVVE